MGEIPVLEENIVPVRVRVCRVEGVLPLRPFRRHREDGRNLSLLICEYSLYRVFGENDVRHVVGCVPFCLVVVVREGI